MAVPAFFLRLQEKTFDGEAAAGGVLAPTTPGPAHLQEPGFPVHLSLDSIRNPASCW
jgi:hypothetical protein